jgi:hypothetical protein
MSDREIPGFDIQVVNDAVRQPPLDQLYSAAGARRRRRSSAIALVAIAAAVGMAVVPLAAGWSGVDWARPDTTESPTRDVTELFVLDDKSAVGVQVTDDGCSVRFARTEDLGRTWSEFQQLRYEGACGKHPVGQQQTQITYYPLSVRTYFATVDGSRSYLSSDGGRTWRDAQTSISVVDAFPPQADPVVCPMGCPGMSEPLAVDPETGAVFQLRAQPSRRLSSLYESPDGALWATFWPQDSPKPLMVARSVDRGATWQNSYAPTRTDVVGVVGESGQVAYLLAEPQQSGPGAYTTGTSRLLKTTDGGLSWLEVKTDLPTAAGIRPFTLGTDQSLMVADGPVAPAGPNCSVRCDENERYVWISHDGGRHFTKGPAVSGFAPGAIPGRIWVFRQDSRGQEAQVTSDGSTWTRLPLPQ